MLSKVGDLVRARGEFGDSGYQREGATLYTTDRNVDRFDFLRAAKDEPQEQAPAQDDMSEIPY